MFNLKIIDLLKKRILGKHGINAESYHSRFRTTNKNKD